MMLRTLTGLTGLAVVLLGAAPASATKALEGDVESSPFVQASDTAADNPDGVLDGWKTTGKKPTQPHDLSADNTAHKTAKAGAVDVTAHAKMSAHWDSADMGSVEAIVSRTITIKPGSKGIDLSAQPDGAWDYKFKATQDGVFNLGFTLTGKGDLTGLGVWFLEVEGRGPDDQEFPLTRGFGKKSLLSGNVQFALKKGETYSLLLDNIDQGAQDAVTNKSMDGSYDAKFNWSIVPNSVAAVPEPATWALMIGGFGLAGASLRRRRLRTA